MHAPTLARRAAFTLVELSVVLVIIGLLAGGIMVGENLIKSSRLRATITQINEIDTALNAFRTQYHGIPGDLSTANQFWPAAVPGNGDGHVSYTAAGSLCPGVYGTTDHPDCGDFTGERSEFFKQLGLSGLANGYDNTPVLGKGYPAIKMHPDQGMVVTGAWPGNLGTNMPVANVALDGLYLYMGVCNPGAIGGSGYNDCAIFVPDEAWNIDTKLDDGNPGTGIVLSESFNTTCTLGNLNTAYNLTSSNQECNLLFSLSR